MSAWAQKGSRVAHLLSTILNSYTTVSCLLHKVSQLNLEKFLQESGCSLSLDPLPALAACHRMGMVCSQLVLFSPLFCVWAWRCLRAFRVVAIPQSGLPAQVSSLRLPSGHSGQILTLSNAACTSLPSPCLLVAGASVCAASPLGELPLGT